MSAEPDDQQMTGNDTENTTPEKKDDPKIKDDPEIKNDPENKDDPENARNSHSPECSSTPDNTISVIGTDKLWNPNFKKNTSGILRLCKIPHNWHKKDLYQYVKDTTKKYEDVIKGLGAIYMKKNVNGLFSGTALLYFKNEVLRQTAYECLRNSQVTFDGQKIFANFTKISLNQIKGMEEHQIHDKGIRGYKNINEHGPYKIINSKIILHQEANNLNLHETYGLEPALLKQLKIVLPLHNVVFVSNLPEEYSSEEGLNKLFTYAGTVVSVLVRTTVEAVKKATVIFDHPVEAVQAISMFNNQEICGRVITVRMDKYYKQSVCMHQPAGLPVFGPGLGEGGLALKNVRASLELRQSVNMIMKKIDELRTEMQFKLNKFNNSENTHSAQQNSQPNTAPNVVQNQLATLASSLSNPTTNPLLALSALLNPQATQMLQTLTQANAANNLIANNSQQTQGGPPPQTSSYNAPHPMGAPNVQNLNVTDQTAQMMNMYPQPTANNYQAPNQTQVNPPLPTSNFNVAHPMPAQNMQNPNIYDQTNQMTQMYSLQSAYNNYLGTNALQMNPQQSPNIPQPVAAPPLNPFGSGPNIPGHTIPAHNMPTQNTPGQNVYGEGQHFQQSPKIVQSVPGQGIQDVFTSSKHSTITDSGFSKQAVKHGLGSSQGDSKRRRTDEHCVRFKYLPPSVTASALLSKMHEVGSVRSSELTGAGRARVSFYSAQDAQTCIKLLNGTKVDGQIIEVKLD